MNRARLAIALAVVALFAVTSGVILLANQNHRGRNLTFNVAVTDGKSMSVAPCFPATCTSDTLSATQNDNVTINITSHTTPEHHLHLTTAPSTATPAQTIPP